MNEQIHLVLGIVQSVHQFQKVTEERSSIYNEHGQRNSWQFWIIL